MDVELEQIVEFMTRRRVQVVQMHGVRVEMHPSAFAPPPEPPALMPTDDDVCACGHSLVTEHSPAGCLHGCAVATCNTTR
jgi:hypothetical protein